MDNKYESQEEFFEKCGEGYIHPTEYGECYYSVTVEEMFQHFKARLVKELVVDALAQLREGK